MTAPVDGRAGILVRIFAAVCAIAICIPSARAWTSAAYFPVVRSVHQDAIQQVLGKSGLRPEQLQALSVMQSIVDKNQAAGQSDEHAMTGIETPSQWNSVDAQRRVFISRSNEIVAGALEQAIADRQAGRDVDAMAPLGVALHILEDATSPAHEGFQTWPFDVSWFQEANHIRQEYFYPTDTGSDSLKSHLESVVRFAYCVYLGSGQVPASYFDAQGRLALSGTCAH
jgi:hypothetical protein